MFDVTRMRALFPWVVYIGVAEPERNLSELQIESEAEYCLK